MSAAPLRVANCSGFYGDRLTAPQELLEGGPIDVLTGDYLAELTMLILWKSRLKDPEGGYAKTFYRQMEEVLGTCVERGVRIVTNAGGLNPAGLAARLGELADRLGIGARIAYVSGDDVLATMIDMEENEGAGFANLDTGRTLAGAGVTPVSANAYLGAWGIVEALGAGADVVVCPRVTDASLVVGPAAWRFGWDRTDWDRLASAVVAGHILECGAQATGGNYAFFEEVPGLEHPGFPIAEIEADGSFIVTKHPGTGGLVSTGTVTAQLLYEIGGPAYANPDAVARFDSIRLDQVGPDRVRVTGVKGEAPPDDLKVSVNYLGGYRNSMTLVLTGLDVAAKADLVERTLRRRLEQGQPPAILEFRLARTDHPDPPGNEEAAALLTVTAKDPDPARVGRAFSNAVIELVLASYPGFFTTTPPTPESPYGVYWPTLIPSARVRHTVVLPDGGAREVPPIGPMPPRPARVAAIDVPAAPSGPTVRVPLGRAFGARSGDKGGNANVGVWARSPAGFAWLREFLSVDRFKELIPEAAGLEVQRYELANLAALNFVVVGLLGEGVASSTRFDPQAKGLGEYLRAHRVDLPAALVEG